MSSAPRAGATAALPAPKVRLGLALAVISGALALDVGSLNVINAALPAISERFDLDNSTLQWVMTSYSITFAGFLLLSGRLADILGRRLIFALGVGLFTAAALGGAIAPNEGVLIAARAVQGIGAALSGPAALALLGEVFPEGTPRNRAFGVYAAVGSVSASAGLVLGGVLTQLMTWRSVFAVSVLCGVLVLLGVKAGLPAGVRRTAPLDLPGAVTVTAGLILAVFGVSQGEERGWGDPLVVASLAVAVALLVSFVLLERRATDPLIPMELFRAVPVRAAFLAASCSYTCVVGLLFFAPLYLQETLGYSPLTSALAVLPLSCAVFVVANYLSGPLLARFGQRPLLAAGLLLVALGIASWVWTSPSSTYWVHMLPGIVVIGLGMGVAFPAMTAAGLTGVPAERHGVAGAINVVAQQIGSSLGLALLVVVASATAGDGDAGTLSGYHGAYLFAAAVGLLGALAIGAGRGWDSRPRPAAASGPRIDAQSADGAA
ncbi:MFS transporter [Kitasatospora sp. NPDC004799]|uniref:MFS transporter n=1 Tax=Kitasatospora sp. NPDC004799 TaxID=3154460 RepID=UPI0033AA88D7